MKNAGRWAVAECQGEMSESEVEMLPADDNRRYLLNDKYFRR